MRSALSGVQSIVNHSFGVEGDGKGLRTWYLRKTGSSYHIDLLLRIKIQIDSWKPFKFAS